jgi:hypothetical protein
MQPKFKDLFGMGFSRMTAQTRPERLSSEAKYNRHRKGRGHGAKRGPDQKADDSHAKPWRYAPAYSESQVLGGLPGHMMLSARSQALGFGWATVLARAGTGEQNGLGQDGRRPICCTPVAGGTRKRLHGAVYLVVLKLAVLLAQFAPAEFDA